MYKWLDPSILGIYDHDAIASARSHDRPRVVSVTDRKGTVGKCDFSPELQSQGNWLNTDLGAFEAPFMDLQHVTLTYWPFRVRDHSVDSEEVESKG